MSRRAPAVSVLMAVHNGERFVREAVESVLAQTLADFEFIIVDDASTDSAPAILDSFDDTRIVRLRNQSNLGLTRSLNLGLAHCRAPLVARMDGDDACEPERFAEQAELLAAHPRTAVAGCLTHHVDEAGRTIAVHAYCGGPAFLKWDLARWNPLFHPTAMMRREVITAAGGYDESFRYAQDYDLFARLVMAGHELRLIERPLLRFRVTAGSITSTRRPEQAAAELRVRRRYVRWLLGREPAEAELEAARWLMSWAIEDPEPRVRAQLRAGLALLLACRRAVRPQASARERSKIDATIRRFLAPRAKRALGSAPRDAAALAAALLRMKGGAGEGARLLVRAARVELHRLRRGGGGLPAGARAPRPMAPAPEAPEARGREA